MNLTRRDLLAGAAALATTTSLVPWVPAHAAEMIKLGSILDTSGIFDAYGKPMQKATELAVAEINAAGGLNGEKIELVSYDTQSDMALYTQYGQQLARQDKVDVVHGGILSASREAIRPTLRKSKTLYFYNVQYEGGVCDRNIFITGVTPAQQAAVLIPNVVKDWGKKVYILAADYNYGQITAKWVTKYAQEAGGEVVSTDFFPLDVADFGSTIAKIQSAAPDLIVSALVGGAHLSFYRQWAAAGLNKKIPMASTTIGVGNEHKVLTPEEGNGIRVAYNYSHELASPTNQAFLKKWAEKFGNTDDIHELAVSTYQGVWLWAEAVKKAGTQDRMPVIEALEADLSIEGPGGKVTIDPKTHHATLDVHLMEFQDQKMKVLEDFSQRPPLDTQAVCDLQANPDDNQQYEIKI
ncbi:urea ABC transporter substrate-binding protein [Oceanibacterium hippocampi]|uniref:Aliphatic amidase expression-regulating protein n=1 Tax=Oceanibacterium hippocampi TaxID=745714 RepID=A0A1Y5TI70_9PROT|nr:ABC transporter substrate-binding protein [Oceanibacterium hippocampi]SLN60902.1 Aliphatic amidase expression-regulating protein [Oceanibacterium hippocampi]